MIVEDRPDLLRVGEARGGGDAVARSRSQHAGVVVINRQTSGPTDIDAIRTLLVEFPDTPIIILPPRQGTPRARRVLQATVTSLLGKVDASRLTERDSPPTPMPGAQAQADTPTRHGGLAGWQIRRLTAYVDEHLSETIHVRDLAAVTRLSLGHFAHAFKQSFGEPPLAHVTRRRLERACERMLASDEPLSRIAQDCGFCDQSHFTRHFHRAMGMTPQHWRRLHATGPG